MRIYITIYVIICVCVWGTSQFDSLEAEMRPIYPARALGSPSSAHGHPVEPRAVGPSENGETGLLFRRYFRVCSDQSLSTSCH